MLNIIVCVKQVPDTTEVKIDSVTNTLIRDGIPSILNPFDKQAVETALGLKDTYGGKVTILSMGPHQAAEALKECKTMGADQAYLISDRAFGGADTLATSYTLAAAVKKIDNFDLIICGKQAIDGDTGQVGPEIAEHLGIPQVTYVTDIKIEGSKAILRRQHELGEEVIKSSLPLLLTVIAAPRKPRYGTIKARIEATRSILPIIAANDLEIDCGCLGLTGSPTLVKTIFVPEKHASGIKKENLPPQKAAQWLTDYMISQKLL